MSCTKAQEFLGHANIQPSKIVDAKKERIGATEAVSLAKKAEELWVSKGTKFKQVNLKDSKLKESEIAELMLGPTGNLRAPTLLIGKVLLVGFNESVYKQFMSV